MAAARDALRAYARPDARLTALGDAAAATAYGRYLGSPDPLGPSATGYDFRTLSIVPSASGRGVAGGGPGLLAVLLGAALGAAALWGLAALWARS